MRVLFSVAIASILSTSLVVASLGNAHAGENKQPNAPSPQQAQQNAPSTWNTAVSSKENATGSVSGTTFDDRQMMWISKINEYFKTFDNIKGKFAQYSAKKKPMLGKYYIKRPGRFRFDYNRPSRMVIVSDGKRLVIQDHDLNTEDEIALKKTPFRVLLRKNVDILRDSRITLLQETDDQIIIELRDKNPRVYGGIKLFLVKEPELELKEWITTDVQGLKTRLVLRSLERVEKLSAKLFRFRSVMLPKF